VVHKRVPLAAAQQVLGDETRELTARVYTHLELDDLRAAVEPGRGDNGPSGTIVATA